MCIFCITKKRYIYISKLQPLFIMKSLLLAFLGFFYMLSMSAQTIPESKFIEQLETKQKELNQLLEAKNRLDVEVAIYKKNIDILSNNKEKTKEEVKELEQLIKDKKGLETNHKSLIETITTKCTEYREFQTFLGKYQNVSQKNLDKYAVRACELFEPEEMTAAKPKEEVVAEAEIAEESDDDRVKKALEKRQKDIDDLVELKDKNDEATTEANAKIKELKSKLNDEIETEARETLEASIKEGTEKRDSIVKEGEEIVKKIKDSCTKFKEYKEFLKDHENVKKEVLDEFKARNCRLFEENEKLDPEEYIIIGDNKPVKVDSLFSTSSARQVLSNVFSIDSQTNLGTFEIPGDNSFINFYVHKKKDFADFFKKRPHAISVRQKKSESQTSEEGDAEDDTNNASVSFDTREELTLVDAIPEGALFKSIQIELREGGIVDTRLVLQSVDGKFEFYFEGVTPVSILNYTRKVKKSFLQYSHYVSLDGKGVYNENALSSLLVRYTEVLKYHPNAGSNYVPDDVSYKFPSDDKDEATKTERRSYQVINDNHLQHVLDLRTYTDLLGLFGDEANGLFQIEGRAEFFIHPFNVRREAFYYLKKIMPYVRYSRFDEDNDFLLATMPDATMGITNPNPEEPDNAFFNDRKLDLLERSNIEMGVDMNVINFRLFKESPFWTSLYVPFSYNVTKVRTDASEDNNDANFKTLGLGVGLNFEIRRFNNFGLNFGYELKGYSFIGDYEEFNLSEPGYMRTQAVKAEIFYYPGLDKSNSIFLRMRSIRDISSGRGDSFFQLQFGYRFTLGVGAIKAR